MTNADWISKKITEFFENNDVIIWKISLIVCIVSFILIFVLHSLYLLISLIPSLLLSIIFTVIFIDEWMEQEHKETDI